MGPIFQKDNILKICALPSSFASANITLISDTCKHSDKTLINFFSWAWRVCKTVLCMRCVYWTSEILKSGLTL